MLITWHGDEEFCGVRINNNCLYSITTEFIIFREIPRIFE
jgi:hypothetical protein